MKNILSPQIGSPVVVYDNERLQIRRIEADFGSFTKEYFVWESGQRAGMVAARDGSLLLIQQYRLLINGFSWEIPGGKVDDGETPQAAAVRECMEESGIRCLNPRPLISFHAGLDVIHNPTHVFFADDLSEDDALQNLHPHEVHAVSWFPLEQCNEMISNGQVKDSFSILAILAYQMEQAGPTTRTWATDLGEQ